MADELLVEINNNLGSYRLDDKEGTYWQRRTVHKIRSWITDCNEAAFVPQVVSFGPYHHGREQLQPMELHKQSALLHFLRRSTMSLGKIFEAIGSVAGELKHSYDQLEPEWREDTDRFLKMMILDGCFMLELLRFEIGNVTDYAWNDPVFSEHGRVYAIPVIKRDMLMIENQLPMLLLDVLLTMVRSAIPKNLATPAALRLRPEPVSPIHYRRIVPSKTAYYQNIAPSATELDEAGVLFLKIDMFCLRDIKFERGVLRLPIIKVDNTTESIFLSLMAFERFHATAGPHVTSFIFFMKSILDTERDVALLVRRGIIQNAYGHNKDVADLFNRLARYTSFDAYSHCDPYNSLWEVHNKVNEYRKKPWNRWRATLVHVYFGNPWVTISVIGGVSIFVLTLMQTIYSGLSYHKQM